jgi:hypothetical protein
LGNLIAAILVTSEPVASGPTDWLWPIVAAVSTAVVATVLVPFLTVVFTKWRERVAADRAARKVAALRLVNGVAALGRMYSSNEASSREAQTPTVAEYNQAIAEVLVLTNGRLDALAEYLGELHTRLWTKVDGKSHETARIMASWVPKGRVNISTIPSPLPAHE